MKKLGNIKKSAKGFILSDTSKGQAIAAGIKLPLSLFMTDLGAKIIFSTAGAIGGIMNESMTKKASRKNLLRHTMANLMFTFADPTANQLRAISSELSDLMSGMRYGNFSTAFGSLIEEPTEVISALKGAIPSFSLKNPFKGMFGSAGFNLRKGMGLSRKVKDLKDLPSVYAKTDDMISF